MGNINSVEGDENGLYDYYRSSRTKIGGFEREVLTIQQHRSQAHTENRQREVMRSQYTDDKRLAIYKMVEQINLQTKLSTEFLELLSH